MDKQAFINEYHQFLDESDLSVDQVQVGAGGIMLMLGMRDTTGDLDLELSEEIFYRLVEERGLEIVDLPLNCRLAKWSDLVDIHPVGDVGKGSVVEGVRIGTVESVLELKHRLGRAKDQRDIHVLEKYLAVAK